MSFDTDLSPSQSWQVVKWKNPNTDFVVHRESLDFLFDVLHSTVKKEAKIFKITEHDKIIPVLETEKVKNANIFNIDYHHDISYGEDDTELNIENWVTHAKRRGIMKTYNWLTQFDARPCSCSMLSHSRIDWDNVDIAKLPKFDIVVLCTSRHFTPKEYWGLTSNLESYIKKFTNSL